MFVPHYSLHLANFEVDVYVHIWSLPFPYNTSEGSNISQDETPTREKGFRRLRIVGLGPPYQITPSTPLSLERPTDRKYRIESAGPHHPLRSIFPSRSRAAFAKSQSITIVKQTPPPRGSTRGLPTRNPRNGVLFLRGTPPSHRLFYWASTPTS